MFQLTAEEAENLRFQIGTSNSGAATGPGHGGRRYLPYAFTEEGVAMLSSVLNSKRRDGEHRDHAPMKQGMQARSSQKL
jgi:hypothetical protein